MHMYMYKLHAQYGYSVLLASDIERFKKNVMLVLAI